MSEGNIIDTRSAKRQYLIPVEGDITGDIPNWIKGSLYRNGPALFEIGDCHYNHLFDGLAMVQRFHIENGKVEFNSQYVQSNSYLRNKAANRIVVSEFGTKAFPDPCRTIFDRMATSFKTDEMTDNTSVTVYNLGDELFAATETNVIHRIDSEELTTLGSIRLDKILAVHRATAHFHQDIDTRTTYLLGFINSPPTYAIVSIPPINKTDMTNLNKKYDAEKLVEDAKILAKVPARWRMNPSYFHSFGVTENYFILIESPLTMNIWEFIKSSIVSSSGATSNFFKWWGNERTKIHIIDRKTGKSSVNTYYTEALFTFHHINAYEENDEVIIDLCAYSDGLIVTQVYLKDLQDKSSERSKAYAKRIVVPLNIVKDEENADQLKLAKKTECVAKILGDNKDGSKTVFISVEKLNESDFELCTMNYDGYNGKPYRYSYGVSHKKLVKVDADTKSELHFKPEFDKCTINEAIFVAHPDSDKNNKEDEDKGVVLCPVIIYDDSIGHGRYQNLYVLDAKTMTEIGHAEFKSVSIPMTFHGLFREN